MASLVNLQLAKALTIQEIELFLKKPNFPIFKNNVSTRKAKNIKYLLEHAVDDMEILIILLTMFDPTLKNHDKSNRFTEGIAESLISGEVESGLEIDTNESFSNDTLSSTVFSKELIIQSKNTETNFSKIGFYKWYDHVSGIKHILEIILETQYKNKKDDIHKSILNLQNELNTHASKMILESLLHDKKLTRQKNPGE